MAPPDSNSIFYLAWDYNWLSVRSLAFFSQAKKEGVNVTIIAPYKFDWFLKSIAYVSRFSKSEFSNQIQSRKKVYDQIDFLADRVLGLSSVSYILYLFKRYYLMKEGIFNIHKRIIDQKILRWVTIKEGDIIYGTEGASLQLFSKTKPFKNTLILEAQAIHIDTALDIEEKFTNVKPDREKWWYEKHRREIDLSNFIIAYSDFQKDTFIQKSGKKDTEIGVIPLSSRFPKSGKYKEVQGIVEFLFVGRVGRRKGVDKLLEIWRKGNIKGNLHIVGKEDDLKMNSCPQGVYFHGYQNGQYLINLFKQCHVFVFPTFNDSFGMVIQEALSFNMPVITNNNCGASALLENQITGLIYDDPFDINDLEESIKKFTENPKMVEEYSKNILNRKPYDREDELLLGRKIISAILN
ncbi:MAG: glycosyltransferase family 4 protein [Cyclobacteriaceae bacterium]|nr:glycosyltransferase family 4 protein [Cyclobacteriaceae bacterium SS2]